VSATLLGSRLELLQSELERLLSFFEAERVPDPATIDAAWSAVTRSFERVQGTPVADRPAMTELGPWYDVCRPGCCENVRLGFRPALAGIAP